MWDKFIAFFAKRHMLANMMFIGIMTAGVYFWFATNKEELPNVTRDMVRISCSYPGASAEQVEHFVTKEIEERRLAVFKYKSRRKERWILRGT